MAINIGTNTDGEVTYENPPVNRVLFPNIREGMSYEEIVKAVGEWLDEHPEVTTTVEDGSLLPVKLDSSNEATSGYILSYNGTKFEWVDIDTLLDDINSEITDLKNEFEQFPNGNYPNMTVGNAEQLVSTVFVDDEVPYNFRTSGGSADIGDREYDEIVGASMPINQYVDKNTLPATTTVNGVTYTNNGDGSITVNGTATDNSRLDNIISIRTWLSHKYLLSGCPSGGSIQSYSLALRGQGADVFDFGSGAIWDASVNSYKGICIYVPSGTVNNLKFVPQFTDLTLTLGTQIADYVYGLETATAGSGVSWLKHHFPKIFDSGYIPFNTGEIQSVSGLSAHKMTGFNQWDEEYLNGFYTQTGVFNANSDYVCCKNKIPVLSNTAYNQTSLSGYMGRICFYDADEIFISTIASYVAENATKYVFTTPSNAKYMTFDMKSGYGNVYKNDICVNLHWDGERDGEYEAYHEYVYPLDDSVVLRGKLELDSNNNLRANGDRYLPDGTVERTWGIVDLGSLTWEYSSTSQRFDGGTIQDLSRVRTACICSKYTPSNVDEGWSDKDKVCCIYSNRNSVFIKDTSYTDVTAFATAMNGVYLVYEKATATTETAEPYQTPQIVDDWGTEEYVSTSLVPVGHDTKYANNLRAKLEMLASSPDENGDYIVRHNNGENEYVALGSTTTIQSILDRLTALENA